MTRHAARRSCVLPHTAGRAALESGPHLALAYAPVAMAALVAQSTSLRGFAQRGCAPHRARAGVGRCAQPTSSRLRPVAAGPLRCAATARRPRQRLVTCAAAGDGNSDKEPERDEGACAPSCAALRRATVRSLCRLTAAPGFRRSLYWNVQHLLAGPRSVERRRHFLRRARGIF